MIRETLKFLFVLQTRKKRRTEYRLNPFNPLSYLVLICAIAGGVLLFGVVGFWEETSRRNPFKWL